MRIALPTSMEHPRAPIGRAASFLAAGRVLLILMAFFSAVGAAVAQQPNASGPGPIAAPEPQPASVSGTVEDMNGDIIPGATVVLDGPTPDERRTALTDDNGGFDFTGLKPNTPYHITIGAQGFANWVSPVIVLNPGQYLLLKESKLEIEAGVTSVTVNGSPEQIATEQVKVEERQRVLGIVPNFYVVYDRNPAPLTAKLKFKLALRALTDPVTTIGFGVNASIYQAARYPDYVEGAKGYGQRLGSTFAGGYTNIMVGDAILPSILHQDPRYFYMGTGTTKSRVLHALSSPFITRGDDGRREINYSNIGGDLASGAIANAYYPEADRGAGLVLKSALIGTGGRMANSLIQEFVLRRLTPSAKKRE